jgi:hypothetical protein
MNLVAFLFQEMPADSAAGGVAATAMLVVWFAVVAVVIAAIWKVFVKAGEPGWAALIPIYNLIVMLKIAGKPAWWVVLMLIPGVNLIVAIIMYIGFAQAFGKGAGFAFGLLLLPFVFFPILAWGDARHSAVMAPA